MKNLKEQRNAHVLSAIENLKVIDTVLGARLESEVGDTVFTLIPREYAIEKLTHVNKSLRSLYALDDSQTKAEVRGKTRVTVAEDDGKYITVGLKPNRGKRGIFRIVAKKVERRWHKKICQLISTCQDVAKGYVPANELRGLQFAKMMAQWPNLKGVSSQQIWGSLACGKNYYLNSHFDEDFFIFFLFLDNNCFRVGTPTGYRSVQHGSWSVQLLHLCWGRDSCGAQAGGHASFQPIVPTLSFVANIQLWKEGCVLLVIVPKDRTGGRKWQQCAKVVQFYFCFMYLASMEAMNSQNVLEDV